MSGRRRSAVKSGPRLRIEHVPIDTLRPDPTNPRVMPEHDRDALDRSLAEFGFVEPIVARRSDNRIIGGHMRAQAAIRNGNTEVPVVYVDVSDEQAHVLALALNRIHGQWDDTLLARLLADLQSSPDVNLALTGFADDEIARLLKSLDAREKRERVETFDLDAALAQKSPTRARLGEVWQLGRSPAYVWGRHRWGPGWGAGGRYAAHRGLHRSAVQRGARCPRWPPTWATPPSPRQRRPDAGGVGGLCTWLGREPARPRGWRALRLHVHQGMAAGLAGAGGAGWPLVRHPHLGEGPLRAGPRGLPTPVRTDLVRVARGRDAALVRGPRSG